LPRKGPRAHRSPAQTPQPGNGGVERAQSSSRYQFYAANDLSSRVDNLQPLVDDAFACDNTDLTLYQALARPRRVSQDPPPNDLPVSYRLNPDAS
jgi:hypothetical protein